MEGEKGYRKGLWTEEEDRILKDYIRVHGKGRWSRVAKMSGLKRGGKSCRLRWINYLSPNVKHGDFSEEEDDLIIRLHNLLGNRWALIAGRVPGRTDNQIKNHWNTHLSKKMGLVKKDSRTKPAGASSQTLSSKSEAANNNVGVSMGTNISETPSEIWINVGSADEEQEVIVSDGSQNDQVGLFHLEDQPATGLDEIMSCQDPFWFSNVDPNLSTASLMGHWENCSFDFMWHGL